MKNILITGSHGYIGTNLVSYLRKDKYTIHGLDKTTGCYVEFLKKIGECDCIVHLAALPGIQACEDDLVMAIKDNISSAFNIFNLAIRKNIPIVFLSSQAAKEPQSSTYAMMKKIIETQAEMLNKECKSNIKILRLTNVYGGVDYLAKKNTVVKKFIEAYRNNEPMIIDGDGKQTRDFIHVDDVCEYIRQCIEMGNVVIDEPIDIGTGTQTSIFDLWGMFEDGLIEYNFFSRSVGVETNSANIERAIEIFGYRASNRLDKYIQEKIQKERNKYNV